MVPGFNPRDMQKAMKRLGIQQQDIDASEVIIKCADKEIIISNPSVAKVNMMGQETFQVSGEITERELGSGSSDSSEPVISEDDIKTVMDSAKCSKEKAEEAIKKHNGDLAAAIMELQG